MLISKAACLQKSDYGFELHMWKHHITAQGGNRFTLYSSDTFTPKTITSSLAQNLTSSFSTN